MAIQAEKYIQGLLLFIANLVIVKANYPLFTLTKGFLAHLGSLCAPPAFINHAFIHQVIQHTHSLCFYAVTIDRSM